MRAHKPTVLERCIEALGKSSSQGDIESTLRKRLESGASLDEPYDDEGSLLLCDAILIGHEEAAKALLNTGADPNIANGEPLLLSLTRRQFSLAKVLIENGADINLRNKRDSTAFLYWVRNFSGVFGMHSSKTDDFERLDRVMYKHDPKGMETVGRVNMRTTPMEAEILEMLTYKGAVLSSGVSAWSIEVHPYIQRVEKLLRCKDVAVVWGDNIEVIKEFLIHLAAMEKPVNWNTTNGDVETLWQNYVFKRSYSGSGGANGAVGL